MLGRTLFDRLLCPPTRTKDGDHLATEVPKKPRRQVPWWVGVAVSATFQLIKLVVELIKG